MTKHAPHPLREKVDLVLKRLGGFYNYDDVMEGIAKGDFQSFAKGDSWVVTRVAEFPRKDAVEIFFMLGNMDELRELEGEVIAFAKKLGITTGLANGRLGIMDKAFPGWKAATATFIKDFENV